MNAGRQIQDEQLLGTLRRHQLTRAHDRFLCHEMEAAWRSELGMNNDELLAAVDRLVRDGIFAQHRTADGIELEVTTRGAQVIRHPAAAPAPLERVIAALNARWHAIADRRRARRVARLRGDDAVPPRRPLSMSGIARGPWSAARIARP